MAGTIKVDSINADSNLTLKIANTAVAFIDATGLRPTSGNVNLDATATSKLYLPSANTVAIQTAGVTAITVDTSQNVGIGTTAPQQRLGIKPATNVPQLFLMQDNVANDGFKLFADSSAGYLSFLRTTTGTDSEKMRIDINGNVGIGTASPSTKLAVAGGISGTGAINISGSGWGVLSYVANSLVIDNNAGESRFFATGADASTDGSFLFYTSQTDGGTNERLRITSAGVISQNGNWGTNASTALRNNSAAANKFWQSGPDVNNAYIVYNQAGNGVYVTDGGTSWAGLSDERLKDIIEPITNGLNKVSTLRTVIGKFKTDAEGTRRSFLIAQDVQSVLPEAISIQNEETGTLGLSYTDVIPLLVASIKELKALNDTQAETIATLTANLTALTARITALESTP